MDILDRAVEFENRKFSFKTSSDRIVAAREAKEIILAVNEVYKQKKRCQINGLNEASYCNKTKNRKTLKRSSFNGSIIWVNI